MPVFTWTPDGSMKIQKGFGYYWSVTVSLTLIILMVWGASMAIPHRHRRVLGNEIELESLSPISIDKIPTSSIIRSSNSSSGSRKPSIEGSRSQNSPRPRQRSSNHRARIPDRSWRNSANSRRISSDSRNESWEIARISGVSHLTSNDSHRSISLNQQ